MFSFDWGGGDGLVFVLWLVLVLVAPVGGIILLVWELVR